MDSMTQRRFPLGQRVTTPGALVALLAAGMSHGDLLSRHERGDWGDLDAEDKATNERAVRDGNRILSAYTLPRTGEKVWVITEWDRSATTVLLPDEY